MKDQASDKVRRIANSFSSGTRNADKFSSSVDKSSKSVDGLTGVTGRLARWIGPAVLGAALISGAFSASKLSRELEQTKISFEVLLGSAKQGQKMLGDIRELALATPFGQKDLQDSAKLLLSFGVSSKKILPTLNTLSNIAQGSKDKLYHLSLAFAQMSSAGRLMGQDLLQMVNAGFNPLQIISQKTGISMAMLKKKMEDGAISAAMVEAAFKSATEAGGLFYKMNEKQAATFEGRLSKLSENIEIFSSGIGDTINTFLSPVLDIAISKLDMLIDKSGTLKGENDKSRDSFKHLYHEITPLLDQYANLYARQNKSKDQQVKMNELMQKIGSEIPGAVTKWDQYGNVLAISTVKARDLIGEQQKMFLQTNAGAQDALNEKLKALNKESDYINSLIVASNKGNLAGDKNKNASVGLAKLAKLGEEKLKIETQLSALRGDRVKAFIKDPKTKVDQSDPYADLKKDTSKKKDKDGVDKITGGGKQAVNVTINLENLIGTQNFDVKNFKDTLRNMEVDVTEALLRVLNSANYAANQ